MITNEWDVKLFKAIEQGEIEVVKKCLKNGANASAINRDGYTALSNSIPCGILPFPNTQNLKDIQKNKSEIVKILVENGADVNQKTKTNGSSPLSLSIYNHQFETAKCLIDNGANVTISDDVCVTPLHWACSISKDHKDNNKNLEQYELVKMLIEKGADVNAEYKDFKETPLFWAIKNPVSYIHNIAELLIENGADVNYKSKHGFTPLMKAATSLNIKAVELLLKNGADINAKDNNELTVLNHINKVLAVPYPNLEQQQIIDFLIEKGAKLGTTRNAEKQNDLDYLGLDLPNSNNEKSQNIRKKRK